MNAKSCPRRIGAGVLGSAAVALVAQATWAMLLAFAAPAAAASPAGLRLGNDVFIAGEEVRFADEAADDALLAGGEVFFGGATGGDAAIAGGKVRVAGRVHDDLYAAGRDVRLSGEVGGSARLAGGEVVVTDSAHIEDGVSIGGREVRFDGRAGSYLQISGGRIRIDGNIAGDVIGAGGNLRVGPEAVIGGRLSWRGRKPPVIEPGAQVRGGVHHQATDRRRAHWSMIGTVAIVWFLGWLLAGALLLALLPRATRAVSDVARARPLAALLAGFVFVIGIPFLILLFAVTLVGIPVALLVLCAYLLLLPLGYLLYVTALGDMALGRRRDTPPSGALRIGAFALALFIAFLVSAIPVLGGLVVLALVLLGAGAIVLAVMQARTRLPATPPSPAGG